jgi:tetratricopeptide (TPR) repeat protein
MRLTFQSSQTSKSSRVPRMASTALSLTALVAAAATTLVSLGAQSPAAAQQTPQANISRAAQDSRSSVLGSYMAGRVARNDNDVSEAARFYGLALQKVPGNQPIANQAFELSVMRGDLETAAKLAQQLVDSGTDNKLALVMAGLTAFKAGKFADAEALFDKSGGNPVSDLTKTLAKAWTKQAAGQSREAAELLDQSKAAEAILAFYRYHKALISDVAGRKTDARTAFERANRGGENKTLRFALAFAQHASNAGDSKLAQSILQQQIDRSRGDGHPLAKAYLKQLELGEKLPLIATTPSQGLAEAFFGLGEALMSEGGLGASAVYLQFAIYLEPQMPFALATMANIYEGAKRYELANATYERIPKGTPLDTSIAIRRALNLNGMEKVDDAKDALENLLKSDQNNIVVLDTLGSVMRGHKRYAEAAEYYTRAINTLTKPERKFWNLYYARGTSYERLKKWPQAEADLQQALKLEPDQAQVLNYLGYSWVDMGKNLKQGLAHIEKAVRLKPDDGYITDSLGWAHFKLGNFKDAVKWLEKAVELTPHDPVLNDHLGDAYWRVGREREATFQWEQALTLKPEPEDKEKIEKKLKGGLPPLAQGKPAATTKQVQTNDIKPKRRTEVRPNATNPTP